MEEQNKNTIPQVSKKRKEDAIHEGLPKQTEKTKHERIIVDFYADWTSADDGAVYLNDCIIDGNGIETGADRNHAGAVIC